MRRIMSLCVVLVVAAGAAADAAVISKVEFMGWQNSIVFHVDPAPDFVGGDELIIEMWRDLTGAGTPDQTILTESWAWTHPTYQRGRSTAYDSIGTPLATVSTVSYTWGRVQVAIDGGGELPEFVPWGGSLYAEIEILRDGQTYAQSSGVYTIIPAPGAMLLASIGIGCVGLIRRRPGQVS